MTKKRILCSVGTRPEAIKMAPVILALREDPEFDVRLLATAQHRDLLDDVLRAFDLRPDRDLDLMRANQSLPELTGRLAVALDEALAEEAPDLVLAQGDTTSVFMTALAAFYRRVPFGHVEAGLRTGKRYYPYPEEMNRLLASRLADLHFAPTEAARQNLLREGVPGETVHMTGNTVIDALLQTRGRAGAGESPVAEGSRLILVTAHRRENFGDAFKAVCNAIRDLAERFEDVEVVYPVHPNPNVRRPVAEILGDHPRIRLIDPVDYPRFVALMDRAHLILTDSGGVQEEAPALGVPVLVFRDETERPEAVDAGVVRLVGPHRKRIVSEASRLLGDDDHWRSMARGVSPYGDGHASERIVRAIGDFLDRTERGPGSPRSRPSGRA